MVGTAAPAWRGKLLLCTALVPIMLVPAGPAGANPSGGSVVAGQAIIGPGGRTLTINQASNRAVINWKSFSIAAGQTTRFNLPAGAAVLNRVTGAQLSALLGHLYSNGQVYLLNPHGIVIGPHGVVKTGGFIASTLDIPNQQFMQGGPQTLQGDSTAGIVVLGTVKARSGDVLLVAAQVDNRGTLLAPDGKAILAAGSQVLYVPGKDSNIAIEAPAPAPAHGAAVSNTGLIKAAEVQLAAAGSPYALAVNNGGMISAGSVRHVGGHVMLSGGDGDVVNSGQVTAPGGSVTLSGGRVALTGAARVSVAAPSGGGSVTLAASNAITVAAGAGIDANATVKGNGGQISIKAGKATQFAGSATATGGPQGGNGGNAEISGGTLSYTGSVDLRAPSGSTGTLLFDPTDIDVVSGNAAAPSGVSGGLWAFSDSSASQISVGAIETLLHSSNLELQASNSLTFDTPTGTGGFVSLASNSSNTLTLTAPTIAINAPISLPNGTLVFNWPDADITTFSTTAQSITSAASAAITAGTLQIAGNYSTVTLNGAVTTGSLQFTEPGFNAVSVSISNAANAISAVSLDPTGSNRAVTLDIESSSAMALSGNLQTYSTATFVAGGDLTLQSGFALSNGMQTVLASTGGVLNNVAGTGAYASSNGKLRIYSSTNGTGASGTAYDANGIANGAATQSGVSYPSNPDTLDSVVAYFTTTSALPVLTITADSFSRTYGQSDPTFTASYSGGSGGGASELSTLPSFRVLQGNDVNAGSYTIQPYGASSTQDLLAYVNGTLTVNQAVLTITANPASITYGGTLPTFTAGISGFVNGDTSSLVSGLTVGSDAGSAPPAGSYTITPAGAVVATPAGGVEPNYSVSYQTAAFTVNKAPLNVSAVAATADYGGAIPTFQLNFSGFVNPGDAASVPSQFAGVTSAVQGSPVGTYPITLANGNPNSNYTVSYTGANLTIDPVPLTITPNVSRQYGASLPAVLPAGDFTGLVNGDTPSSLTTQPTLSTTATAATGIGSYGITASGAVDANYTIGYAPGTLTITRAPLLITPSNVSLTYGASNPSFSGASYSGLLNGDTSAVVSGLVIGTDAAIAGGTPPHLSSPVGTYSLFGSGASAANYTISYAPGTLTITPASLVIQPSGTGTYGASPATNATVTYNATGFVNGDTLASLTTQPSYSTSATDTSGAGLETLLAHGAVDRNYTISYVPGVLNINPATLVLSPNLISVPYGQVSGATDSYTVSGLANGDTLSTVFGPNPNISVQMPTVNYLSVGSYRIFVQAPTSRDNNYNVFKPLGSLNVLPATLTLTPNPLTVPWGTTGQPLDGYTVSGLVNGDALATVFGSIDKISVVVPTLTGTPGTYLMFVRTPPSIDNNYTISTPTAPLTVSMSKYVAPLFNTTFLTTTTTPPTTETITTTETLQPTAPLDLPSTTTTITVDPASLGIFGVVPETTMIDVINAFVADQNASGHPTTLDQVENDLIDKGTRSAEQALLLPYLYAQLTNLFAIPQANWRPDQAQLAQAVLGFINQQRQLAATQAEDDYAAWYVQQEAQLQAQVNSVNGPEQAIVMAAQSSNPPIPPAAILQEAQLGMYMTNDQAVAYSGIQAVTEDLGDMIQNPSHIPATPNASNTATNETDVTLDAIAFAKSFESMTGARISTGVFKGLFPKLAQKIWLTESSMKVLKTKMAKAGAGKTVSTVDDLTSDSVDAIDVAKAVVGTAAKVLAVGGTAVEIAGALVQIGMAAADYGQIATYSAAFNQAIAGDAPLTMDGLKTMFTSESSSTQAYSYLTLMMATSPQALTPTLPPPAVAASIYESL